MEEPQDPEGKQVKEIYALFGLAVYFVQCFERQLAITLSTVFGPGVKKMTRDQYSELLSSHFKKTLGQLNSLLKDVSLDNNIKIEIADALKIRNILIHNYFWKNAVSFCKPSGREQMIKELNNYIQLFQSVDAKLEKLTYEWGDRYGVDENALNKQLQSLLDSYG